MNINLLGNFATVVKSFPTQFSPLFLFPGTCSAPVLLDLYTLSLPSHFVSRFWRSTDQMSSWQLRPPNWKQGLQPKSIKESFLVFKSVVKQLKKAWKTVERDAKHERQNSQTVRISPPEKFPPISFVYFLYSGQDLWKGVKPRHQLVSGIVQMVMLSWALSSPHLSQGVFRLCFGWIR